MLGKARCPAAKMARELLTQCKKQILYFGEYSQFFGLLPATENSHLRKDIGAFQNENEGSIVK